MKKVTTILICALLALGALGLAGCKSTPTVSAEETVKVALDAYKSGDLATFAKCFSGNTTETDLEDALASSGIEASQAKDIITGLGSAMDYKVVSADERGDTAKVKVEITAVDLEAAVADITGTITEKLGKDPSLAQKTQDELMALVIDEMIAGLQTTDAKKTETVTVKLVVDGGEWKILDSSDNTDFMSALVGYTM